MSESQYTRKFCRSLEAQGALTYPLVGSRYAPPGWPDRYVSHTSWHGFIEFKSFKGKLSRLQQRIHEQLRQRGDNVVVVRFSEESTCIRIEGVGTVFDYESGESTEQVTGAWMNWGGFLEGVTG